jgi:hypothetical protein
MEVRREKQGARVTRKTPHGNSRSAASVKTKSSARKSAYTVLNGSIRVLFPLTPTKIDKRRLSSAVSTVVEKMKD